MQSADQSDDRMERFKRVREQLEALRPEEGPNDEGDAATE